MTVDYSISILKSRLMVLALAMTFTLLSGCEQRSETHPPPQIPLGLLKECTEMGALAEKINDLRLAALAETNEGSAPLPADRPLTRQELSQLVADKVDYRLISEFQYKAAVTVVQAAQALSGEVIKPLATQACVINYQRFNKPEHFDFLYAGAEKCQHQGKDTIKNCMSRNYRRFLLEYYVD